MNCIYRGGALRLWQATDNTAVVTVYQDTVLKCLWWLWGKQRHFTANCAQAQQIQFYTVCNTWEGQQRAVTSFYPCCIMPCITAACPLLSLQRAWNSSILIYLVTVSLDCDKGSHPVIDVHYPGLYMLWCSQWQTWSSSKMQLAVDRLLAEHLFLGGCLQSGLST